MFRQQRAIFRRIDLVDLGKVLRRRRLSSSHSRNEGGNAQYVKAAHEP